MAKNRKRNPAHREAVRYLIFMPYAGTDREIGAAQWRHHLQIGNLVRNSSDAELNQRLIDTPRLAVVKQGLYAYESEVSGSLEFAPLQNSKPIPASPKSSHQAGWQNWLYRPPFTPGLPANASEAHRQQFATEPRYSEVSKTDPTNKVEVW